MNPRASIATSLVVVCGLCLRSGAAPEGWPDPLELAPLTATVYAKDAPGKVLFIFHRTTVQEGSTLKVLREYFNTNGTVAALERVVYASGELVSCDQEEPPNGAHGMFVIDRTGRTAQARFEFSRSGKRTAGTEQLQPDTLVSDMVGRFLCTHWGALTNGVAVPIRFAVITRAQTIGFKFRYDGETTWRSRRVARIRMEPSSWLIARLVEPIMFLVETQGKHRVLQYTGRITPRFKRGNDWVAVDAVTIFDWH